MTTTAQFTAVTLATVLAVSSFAASAGVAAAWGNYGGGADTTVGSLNYTHVNNTGNVSAQSGDAAADGGAAARGGNGGAAEAGSGLVGNFHNTTRGGNGGNSGNGGNGGDATTGKASAVGIIETDTNYTRTTVKDDDCRRCGGYQGDVTVMSGNKVYAENDLDVDAKSGDATANGGDSGRGGEGGYAGAKSMAAINYGNTTKGGNGGDSGNAGAGGTAKSGNADAYGEIVTRGNHLTTKVDVDGCGRCGSKKDDVNVWVGNKMDLDNDLTVDATSGSADANGGDTHAAGNGGSALAHSFLAFNKWNSVYGGNGGDSGQGGRGGEAKSGNVYAQGASNTFGNFTKTTINR